MFWTKLSESARTVLYSSACLSIVAFALFFGVNQNKTSASSDKIADSAPEADFPANAGSLGPVTDNAPTTPRDVTFTVSGLSGTPSNVTTNFTFGGIGHTWVGDIDATLIAPNGTSHILFASTSATTATGAGDSSDLTGPYNFTNAATGVNWWQAAVTAAATAAIPPGNYRTTQAGPQSTTNNSPVTDLTAAFSGVTNPNGTWTLRFTDNAIGDTGTISAANLTVDTAPTIVNSVKNDFDGDSRSDYAVVRNPTAFSSNEVKMNNDATAERGARLKISASPNLGTNQGSSLTWYVNNSANNSTTVRGFGQTTSTDFFVPADYDGDGRADIAIWRSVAATGPGGGFFYILNSATSTVSQIDFGVTNDNPTVVGDYDGDRRADAAVFRCSFPSTNGQCYYFFRGTMNNPNGNITYIPWGNNSVADVFPNRGDFDGDGRFDFCVQRQRPGATSQGQFVLLRSSNSGVEYINWDTSSSFIVPGDYDGDGLSDFMTVRSVGGNLLWSLLTRSGNQSYTNWGTTSIAGTSEFIAQSDYDGDGSTDIAVYRRDNTNPNNCYYYVRRSSNTTLQTFEWGSTTDSPVNGWDVN